jgi:putative acetyltransferase
MGDMVGIRPEAPPDLAAIHAVHLAAFPTDAEARLVDTLRDAGRLTISLVAVVEEGVVGHVAFSPVTVDTIVGGSDWRQSGYFRPSSNAASGPA